MAPRIAIVNYGMGNLRSVEKALERVGGVAVLTSEAAEIEAADGVVLPGVGAFPRAMERIRALGLADPVRAVAAGGRPLLGVCLGMQLLFESSAENGGDVGLGLLPGSVDRLSAPGLKLPHIGWSPLRIRRDSPLLAGVADGEPFYFVHTFAARPAAGEDVLAEADYGESFPAVVGRGQVFGAQFHPEKSGAAGLGMLAAFSSICASSGVRAGA